jgi:hypothetical protein
MHTHLRLGLLRLYNRQTPGIQFGAFCSFSLRAKYAAVAIRIARFFCLLDIIAEQRTLNRHPYQAFPMLRFYW